MKRQILAHLILFFTLCSMAVAQAVDSQQISGTVIDPTGAAVPKATVTVVNGATGLTRTARSNSAGNYVVLDLPVGIYNVTTTSDGFKKSVIFAVHVDIGGKPSVDVALNVGQVGETVEVQADDVMIQTSTAEIGGVITNKEATEIQLNGRNYVQLLTLQPGVSETIASGFGVLSTFGASGSTQSVNGIRPDSENYFIDGVDNKANGGDGNNFVNISPDALQQFRNVASTYDASYGGTSGATVSVAMKSGGRAFHGGAYEFIRNNDIQAYQFRPLSLYQNTQPFVKAPLHYNDFGYTIGGPIWIPKTWNTDRSKLFFFGGQEYKRLRTSTQQSITVPTPAAITAAEAVGPSTATGRELASTLLTSPSGTFSYLSLGNYQDTEYLFKIDYNPNDKNQINGHFAHDAIQNAGNPTNYIVYDRTIAGYTSSVQWTHTINSKSVNTAVGSFSGNHINEGNNIRANPQFGGRSIQRSAYGLTYQSLYNASSLIPQITLSGFSNPGADPRDFDNSQGTYAMKDDFSLVLGNHSLKTGAYFWRSRKNQTAPPQLNGAFTFSGSTPQQVLGNLVNGTFSNYIEGSNIPQVQARFSQFETYVQDDWTAARRLTLNIGLRWQYMPWISSWPNNTSFFDPNYYSTANAATISLANGSITSDPAPYNGLILPGNGFSNKAKKVVAPAVYNNPQVQMLFHNLPSSLINTAFDTYEPRFGFAYDLTGKQSTVLRGGYGISYERVQGNYLYGAASQLPFTAVASFNSTGNVDNLGALSAANLPTQISNSADRHLVPPRVHNYSLGVQQKLLNNTTLEVNYVGTHSASLTWLKDLNQAPAGFEQATPGASAQRNAFRPYKGYGEIYQYTNGVALNYNSLQVHTQTRFHNAGLANLSYTWSQCLAMGSSYNYQPQNSLNLAGDYGHCSYNQPQIFVASYVYPLPFWQHQDRWYKVALGGWQLSGLTRIATGLPINVTQPSGLSVAGDLVTTSSVAQRPNLVGNPYAHGGKQYLNVSAFQAPAAGTFGSLRPYAIRGPLLDNWDATLEKNFVIYEGVGLQFRAEMFNVPNHLSPFTVNGSLGTAATNGTYQANYNSTTGAFQNSFGQVTAATDPRTMEFALRINF